MDEREGIQFHTIHLIVITWLKGGCSREGQMFIFWFQDLSLFVVY